LLFDNAIDGRQVADLIPPPGSILIITSRQYFKLPGMADVHLQILSPDEARSLLLSIAPRAGIHADQIARLCGHLPLALRLAGSALAGWVNLGPEEYANWLSETKSRLSIIDSSLSISQDSLGIETTFKLSYDLLGAEEQKLWSYLAVFPDTFDQLAVTRLWVFEPYAALRVLSDLVVKCLVEWNPNMQRYSLHDLARIFADNQLSESDCSHGKQRLAGHYVQALRFIEALFGRGGEDFKRSLTLFDLEWPNIKAGLEWAKAHADEQVGAELGSEYLKTETRLFNLRMTPRERLDWFKFGLDCAKTLGRREDEASHLKNLGIAYLELGELERSIEAFNNALVMFREIGDQRKESSTLGNLGLAFNAKGEPHLALEYFQQHLEIARETGDRFGEGNALGNIGMAYKNLGKPRQAIPYHEEALAIAREIGDRPGEGATLNDMGNAYYEAGEFEHASSLYNQALDIFREIGDHKNESNALGNLGLAYKELGDFDQAISLYEKALLIDRNLGNRVGEEITLNNLSEAYRDLGEIRKAIDYSDKAFTIALEIGDQYGQADALRNRGLAVDKLGDRNQARSSMREALELFEKLGIEDNQTKQVREKLADWSSENPE
jgi:tetratricopeptide (TPR) repeat protein